MDLLQGGPLLGVRPGDPPSREAGGRAREASRGAGAAPAGVGVRDRRQAREALAALAARTGGRMRPPPGCRSGPGVGRSVTTDRDDTPSPLSMRVRQGGNMTINVEPVAAVIGTCLVAIAVMFAKRFASWIGKAIGRAIIDSLRSYWKADMDTELSAKLAPIYAELQIGDGTEKWPNGSDTLPQTMQTIYDRQRETWLMVRDMQMQLEAVLTDRGN